MFRPILFIAVASVLGAVAFAAAQTGGHGSHGTDSPTAAHRRMHATLEERNGVIAKGLGAGLAFPADQNYYPGPLHLLEHKDALRVTAQQERRMEALQTRLVLTEEQRRIYHELRWGS